MSESPIGGIGCIMGYSRLFIVSILLFLFSACGGGSHGTNAGDITVKGLLVDPASNAISGALIEDLNSGVETLTDKSGYFELGVQLPPNQAAIGLRVTTETFSDDVEIPFSSAPAQPVISVLLVADSDEKIVSVVDSDDQDLFEPAPPNADASENENGPPNGGSGKHEKNPNDDLDPIIDEPSDNTTPDEDSGMEFTPSPTAGTEDECLVGESCSDSSGSGGVNTGQTGGGVGGNVGNGAGGSANTGGGNSGGTGSGSGEVEGDNPGSTPADPAEETSTETPLEPPSQPDARR